MREFRDSVAMLGKSGRDRGVGRDEEGGSIGQQSSETGDYRIIPHEIEHETSRVFMLNTVMPGV